MRRHAALRTAVAGVACADIRVVNSHVLLDADPTETNPPATTLVDALSILGSHAVGMTLLGGGTVYLLLRFGLARRPRRLFTVLSLADGVVRDRPSRSCIRAGSTFFPSAFWRCAPPKAFNSVC